MFECTSDKKGATTDSLLCCFSINLLSILSGDPHITPKKTDDITNNIGFITWEAIVKDCHELLSEEQIDNQNMINICIKNLTNIPQSWITAIVANDDQKNKGKKDKKTDKKQQQCMLIVAFYWQ